MDDGTDQSHYTDEQNNLRFKQSPRPLTQGHRWMRPHSSTAVLQNADTPERSAVEDFECSSVGTCYYPLTTVASFRAPRGRQKTNERTNEGCFSSATVPATVLYHQSSLNYGNHVRSTQAPPYCPRRHGNLVARSTHRLQTFRQAVCRPALADQSDCRCCRLLLSTYM